MAEVLRLREAARLIGVSPGRLTAAPGGGAGKPTLVSLEALQTFCRSEGLRVPDAVEMVERSERLERAERSEHAERSMSPADEALARTFYASTRVATITPAGDVRPQGRGAATSPGNAG